MNWNLLLKILSIGADIAGVIGVVISIFTLRTTVTVKKATQQINEKNKFKKEFKKQLSQLKGYYATSHVDGVFEPTLLDNIDDLLIDIKRTYISILTPDAKNMIDKLQKHIKKNCYRTDCLGKLQIDSSGKRGMEKKLRELCAELGKMEDD